MAAAPLAILGTHTFAEEVADLVEQIGEHELVAFVENWDRERAGRTLAGRPVIWVDELAEHAGEWSAVCAIGSPERRDYIEQVAGLGVDFATVVHPTAVVAPSARLGAGCIVSPGVVVGSHTEIGEHVIVNRGRARGPSHSGRELRHPLAGGERRGLRADRRRRASWAWARP